MASVIKHIAVSLALLALATAHAHARSVPTCAGQNLMQTLQREKPADHQAIMERGGKLLNGNALLWKIEKPGKPASWLFGTMHVTDERLMNVPDDVLSALNGARVVAVENLDIMDTSVSRRKFRALNAQIMFPEGSDLRDVLSTEEEKVLKEAARVFKLSYFKMLKMKPWMAASILALPNCEKQRKAAGAPFLDKAITERAYRIEAKVVSLETIAEQVDAMASLPMPAQVAFLTSSARLAGQAEDFLETMIALYLERKIGTISEMAKYFAGNDETVKQAYKAFHDKLVVKRNLVMRERALALVEEGEAFIAVGALHLPGEKGLVELFRKDGYMLKPVW